MNDFEFSVSLAETIETLAEAKKYKTLRDILTTLRPVDIAQLFDALPIEIIPLLFRLLPKGMAADTFVEMEGDAQQHLIKSFSDSELKEVVDELYIDDAVDIVEEMPANVVNRILKQANPEKRKLINTILQYPDDSAGSIMTTEFVSLTPAMTVADAIKQIRRTGIKKETVNICYICDETRRLQGTVSIRKLILSEDDDLISEVMDPNVIYTNTHDDQEDVANLLSKYDLFAVPVVDAESRLVGIITVDDAMDIMQEEVTDDIEKMAAITPSTRPYLKMNVFDIYKSRIPWLLLLMVSATFTGLIITYFDNALASCVALTAFIPMLMDTGGNCGSQASVTIIRGLSLEEIKFRDILKVMWKEFRVSLMCGITLSAVNFLKLYFFDKTGLFVALTVCVTLVATVVVAKLVGCTLPMIAEKIGFDPTVMASPFITTIVDALSLFIYFNAATYFLGL